MSTQRTQNATSDRGTSIPKQMSSSRVKRELTTPKVTALSVSSPYRFPVLRKSLTLAVRVIALCLIVTGVILSFFLLRNEDRVITQDVIESQRAETAGSVQSHGE